MTAVVSIEIDSGNVFMVYGLFITIIQAVGKLIRASF